MRSNGLNIIIASLLEFSSFLPRFECFFPILCGIGSFHFSAVFLSFAIFVSDDNPTIPSQVSPELSLSAIPVHTGFPGRPRRTSPRPQLTPCSRALPLCSAQTQWPRVVAPLALRMPKEADNPKSPCPAPTPTRATPTCLQPPHSDQLARSSVQPPRLRRLSPPLSIPPVLFL